MVDTPFLPSIRLTQRLVIGTGTGSTAIPSGAFALHIDASAAPNALSIFGNAGRNTLIEGAGFADRLHGRIGNDTLTGGSEADVLLFQTALDALGNRDVLTDPQPGINRIQLKATIFTGRGASGSTLASGSSGQGQRRHAGRTRMTASISAPRLASCLRRGREWSAGCHRLCPDAAGDRCPSDVGGFLGPGLSLQSAIPLVWWGDEEPVSRA